MRAVHALSFLYEMGSTFGRHRDILMDVHPRNLERVWNLQNLHLPSPRVNNLLGNYSQIGSAAAFAPASGRLARQEIP